MTNQYNDWNTQIIEGFRSNDGDLTAQGFGRSLVLVHHIGAKSGLERISPVMSIRDDDDTWLIAASKAGAPENPGWYYNLLAHPETIIETADDGLVEVQVEELTGVTRDAAWGRFKDMSPGFAQYERNTTRVIPVVALRRRAPATPSR